MLVCRHSPTMICWRPAYSKQEMNRLQKALEGAFFAPFRIVIRNTRDAAFDVVLLSLKTHDSISLV